MNSIVSEIQEIYQTGVPNYVVRYINRDYWQEKINKFFKDSSIENETDFNYSKCFSLKINISPSQETIQEYLRSHQHHYSLLIQVSILAPYGMLKFQRYSLENNFAILDASDIPYLSEHQDFLRLAEKFFEHYRITLLKDDLLKLPVPGITLELREGNPSVYNCLFEDLASIYPF